MNKKIWRLCVIAFKKNNTSKRSCNKLNRNLRDDEWWNDLSGTVHQKIGRTIAKYPSYFEENCLVPAKKIYAFTDGNGNGIYM